MMTLPSFKAVAGLFTAGVVLAGCGQSVDDEALNVALPSSSSTMSEVSTSQVPLPSTPKQKVRVTTTTSLPTSSTTLSTPTTTTSTTTTKTEDPLPPGALRLPSYKSDMAMAALLKNVTIATNTDHSCVWIVGSAGDKVAVLWPHGYYAMFEPLRVFDGDGRERMREGKQADVGGGSSPVGVDRIPPKCRVGDTAWWLNLD